ncbi:hypothetical protein M758_4G193200 [Ceratodon purpureus]|nr:hypothetical protein M758_4G193200 [Ceratodon purpureus]
MRCTTEEVRNVTLVLLNVRCLFVPGGCVGDDVDKKKPDPTIYIKASQVRTRHSHDWTSHLLGMIHPFV